MAGALASRERLEVVMEKKCSNIVDLLKELVKVFKESVFPWLLQALGEKLNTLKCYGGTELLRQIHKDIHTYLCIHIQNQPFYHMNDSCKT